MIEWMIGLIETAGYAGVFLLMLLENIFPPIPSELVMPLAGFAAARDSLNLAGVIATGTAGSVAGALPWYWLGRKVGLRRLGDLADRHGRWLTLCRDDLDKSKRWFDRHRGRAVFFGRLAPAVRTLISVPAGVARMPLVSFLVFTTIGSALWTAALAIAGYVLEAQYRRVETVVEPMSWIVLGAILAWYLWRVVRFRKGRAAGA